MREVPDDTAVQACFCGRVVLEVRGAPLLAGYCHCESCRTWAGAPLHGFVLFPSAGVRVAQGAEDLARFQRTPRSERCYCRTCGGHVMNAHPEAGFTDILCFPAPGAPFAPSLHVHYRERVVDWSDDLPKFLDLPVEFGGSGARA